MIRLMVSAPASGSGKTVLTCALLSAFQRRGLSPCAFKCGPDYIDPQFHRALPGVESRNLDLFFMSGETLSPGGRLRTLFRGWTAQAGIWTCSSWGRSGCGKSTPGPLRDTGRRLSKG